MRVVTFFVVVIALNLSQFFTSRLEAKPIIARPASASLDVRNAPSSTATLVGTLDSHTVVLAVDIKDGWIKINWSTGADRSTMESGWVPAGSLLQVRGGSGSSSYTSSGGAVFEISVDDTDLDCTEQYDGGFSGCEVTIDFSYTSDYNGNSDPNVDVECSADLSTMTVDGFGGSESGDDSDTVYGRDGSGEIDIDFSFYSVSKVSNVEIESASCEINGISD